MPHRLPAGDTPFERLVDLMAILRGPDGCPWDREQTHQTLTRYLVEESYEVLETIEDGDLSKLREELGDLLLQVVFHAQLARESGHFDVHDVSSGIVEKMVRRHPHVFAESDVQTAGQVVQQWEEIKLREKTERKTADQPVSLMEGIPRHLPALLAAERMTSRAAEVGFTWDDPAVALDKVQEECQEALEAFRAGDHQATREEMGDLLFAVANACRMMGVMSEDALRQANKKFVTRFSYIERAAADKQLPVSELGIAALLDLWEESKSGTRISGSPPNT
jgi:tetrapyrrole methylase family protein/MazG family protein